MSLRSTIRGSIFCLAGALALGCSAGGGSYGSASGDGGATAPTADGGTTKSGGASASGDGAGVEADERLSIAATKPYTTTHLLITPSSSRTFAKIPKPGNVFLVVTVQLTNDAFPSPLPTDGSHFELRTDSSTVYSFYGPATTMDGSCTGRGSVAKGGTSKACNVAFEIPESETAVAVQYYASTSSQGRTETPVPDAKPGPKGFCDEVNHSTGVVSGACADCLEQHCRSSGFAFEPGAVSTYNLPDGTCTTPSFCTCEHDAYEKRSGRGSFYEDFEGCADTLCAADCVK